ncbi:MAG: hypothetical protein WBA36_08395 [Mesorhizobium sp.]
MGTSFPLSGFAAAVRSALGGARISKVAGLTTWRVLAAAGSLLSVTAIVRFFPADEAGKFFVFLAAAQFVAGAALGPMQVLAIRFGSVHRADDDPESLGRLVLFGVGATLSVVVLSLLAHPFASGHLNLPLDNGLVFACAVGLGGAVYFLGGLARVNGKVIAALVPEGILKPVGIALAAFALWLLGAATFPALATGYLLVLFLVCAVLAAMGPWSASGISFGNLAGYRAYFRAYPSLLLYGLVSTALTTFDIMIVSRYVSVEAVSAYKAGAQYAMLLGTGVLFANVIYGPQIAVAYQRQDQPSLQRLATASSRLSFGFFVVAFLPLLAGPWPFETMFGAVGTEAWLLALILCAGRFVNACFGSVTNIANLSGKTAILVMAQGCGLLLLLLLGPLLGARFGAAGVAAAAGLAMTAWVIATVFFMGRSLKLRMGPLT